jgi:hypothetical protein
VGYASRPDREGLRQVDAIFTVGGVPPDEASEPTSWRAYAAGGVGGARGRAGPTGKPDEHLFLTTLPKRFANSSPAFNGITYLGLACTLLRRASEGADELTYRIQRSETPDTVVFALSGDMGIEHSTQLQEFLACETNGHITLDLKDVTLVDRGAVRFLADAEAAGIRIANCPEYVRSWIAAERDWQENRLHEPDKQEPQP